GSLDFQKKHLLEKASHWDKTGVASNQQQLSIQWLRQDEISVRARQGNFISKSQLIEVIGAQSVGDAIKYQRELPIRRRRIGHGICAVERRLWSHRQFERDPLPRLKRNLAGLGFDDQLADVGREIGDRKYRGRLRDFRHDRLAAPS